ncbi:uncharacterized protein [Palaemon carinicauda]|uniref:uncharacterized protein isoform X2 n=1 Tax=Palaemon carinicauda TaxID=392227 RepID=UPI0035B5AA54
MTAVPVVSSGNHPFCSILFVLMKTAYMHPRSRRCYGKGKTTTRNSAGVVNPNDVLPPPGLHFCNLSLREGGDPSSTPRLTTGSTFPQRDSAIVEHAEREAADPFRSYEDRFQGPSSHESAYDVGYARTDVYCPVYSDVAASEALEYPSYSAFGYQAEAATVQFSTNESYASAVSDEANELPGTSGSTVPYVDTAGGVAAGGGFHKSNVQSTSEESDAPTSSSSHSSVSKKGSYKHRYGRIYGLSKEEQMQRTKTLNNEATQLYRERKRKRQMAIEDDHTKEEEKNRDLLQQERELRKKIEKLKKALGKRDDLDPPGDGSIYL